VNSTGWMIWLLARRRCWRGWGRWWRGWPGWPARRAGRLTLDAMEVLVTGQGRELLRGLVQLALDVQAGREVRLQGVTGEDGVAAGPRRARSWPAGGDAAGEVRVRRIAYRSGVRGAGSLFPRDAVLNLPPCGYSWQLQRLAEMFCRAGSYEQAHQFVLAATGVSIGKRQLEQITIAAAADAERFYRDRAAVPAAGEQEPAGEPGPEREQEQACRRWRSRRTARAWRCSRRRAAAAPGPRSSGSGLSRSGPGPGRRRAASGWPRPGPSSTSPSRTARPAPRSRSCGRRAARAGRSRRGRRTAGTPATSRGPGRHHRQGLRRGRPPRPGPPADLDRPGRRRQLPARPVPGRRCCPRHHAGRRDRLHPRAGVPVEGRLVLPPAPRPPRWKTG